MGIFHADREKSFVIKRPTADNWPTHMGAMYVHGAYDQVSEQSNLRAKDSLRFGRLVGWENCFFEHKKDCFGRHAWNNGVDSIHFWDTLRSYASCCGTVWLWGWNIWPAWCLLNGVKEVSEQRLILDIREPSERPQGVIHYPRRSRGLFIAENPPTIICLSVPGGGRIKLIDLANYGIEPEDFGVDGPAGALAATVHAVKEYSRFCKTYDLGSCQTTAASQAWYCYRRSHMTHPVIVHPIEKVLDLEQAAYYGGRCECLRIGRSKEYLYHLDVNSMYTSIAAALQFPSRYLSTWTKDMGGRCPLPSPMRLAVADVTVKIDQPRYPARETVKVSPFKEPQKSIGRKRVIYPVGTFRTALCGLELFGAVDAGHVVRFHRVQYYEPAPLMNQWANWALDMRVSLVGDGFKSLARCAKKIINSLPGKWGQRMKKWVDLVPQEVPAAGSVDESEWFMEWGKHPGNGEITPYRTIAGQTQYQDREELAAVSCPAIAAHWTSYGRMFLFGIVDNAGWENVYYYDTDSVIVNREGYLRLLKSDMVDNGLPGMLKLKEESDDVEILGIRRYRFGPRWCVAGPLGGLVSGSGDPGQFVEHEGFGAQLWHRSVGDSVEIRRQAKWRKEYHHGTVDENGCVKPFFVGGTCQK
jgi:hypothetical protein